jgi:hypothetical protein
MIAIDIVDALELLKQHGIRVARTKFVDGAEDAIAFAQRRSNGDPRFVPIVLRPAALPAPAETPLRGEAAIREAYGRVHAAADGGRVLAQAVAEPGSSIVIAGRIDAENGKTIALHSATHGVERMVPLDEAGAAVLATNFQAHNHHGPDEKTRRMLEHLLLRVSAFYEDSGVTGFRLDVRLHDNAYTVVDVVMTAAKTLHVKPR